MAFAPKSNKKAGTFVARDPNAKFPVPKAGNRPARISLIVDIGNQNRKDFEEKDGTLKPQKPADQIAIFLDLTSDVVDYGSDIGMQPYRLMLNKSFAGDIDGINFGVGPIRDADGAIIPGRPDNYHPMSVITKLAKATGTTSIVEGKNLDLEQLLNKPLMATVEVKRTEDKNGKLDDKGSIRVYENVNFRGTSEVPEMPDGSPYPVPDCKLMPRVISFDGAQASDIKYIRRDLLAKIKIANNYEGSQMQRAIVEFEGGDADAIPEPAGKEMPAKFDDAFDDDVPF
jgi:hypothetical protein